MGFVSVSCRDPRAFIASILPLALTAYGFVFTIVFIETGGVFPFYQVILCARLHLPMVAFILICCCYYELPQL